MAKSSPGSPSSSSHLRLKSRYKQKFPNTVYSSMAGWRRYETGVWTPIETMQVRKEVQEVCALYGTGTTNSVVSSVYGLVQADVFVPDDKFDSNIDLIAFADCVLEISTGKTRLYEPSDYFTSKLPFAFDPHAKSTTWDSVLGMTNANHLPFLQEYAGYCLTPDTRQETAIWNWGPPGSAKSTFVLGLESMLGTRCCALGLSDIEGSRFALSQITGKTLAVSTEQPSHFVRCSHILNALISGESLTYEQKFRDPVTIRPRIKLVWAMNDLPRIDSSGVGLFRRVVPVPWQRVEQPDPAVKERIKTHGPAIFNWAFEGLQRLNARGRFDIPAELLEERETYRISNDVPQSFINDCCVRVGLYNDEGHYNRVWASDLYVAYKDWCGLTGHKPLNSTTFAAEMKRLGIEKTIMDGRTYYLAIALKPNEDHEVEM